jgi:hypothetical protein
MGFAAYFNMVVAHEPAFRLLYGRDHAGDEELGDALRRVEDAIALAIDPLIAAGLDPEHRRFLAYAVVGMAEGASRSWVDARARRAAAGAGAGDEAGATRSGQVTVADGRDQAAADEAETRQLAGQLADLAWAGLRSVHAG